MQEVQKDGVNDVMSKNNFIVSTTLNLMMRFIIK